MEPSSLSDVKALNEDIKEADTDSASKSIKTLPAQNITCKYVENPGLVSVSVGSHDESTLLEDVKVCDTCGDAGQEHLLATCSKCSDGAEHIYCMRIRLEKVPETDWICEDCALSEYKNNRKQTRFSNSATTPIQQKNETDQEVEASGANMKVNPVSVSKGVDTDKNRNDKLSNQPSLKRPLGSAQSALLIRRKALGLDNVLTSRQYIKSTKSQDSSVKSNNEPSLPKNLSRTRQIADLFTVSGQNIPKPDQLPTSSGLLTKSKSFNSSDRRPKVQFLEKNPETALGAKGKGCAVRSLKKSVSFSDGSANCSSALDLEAKTTTPKLSEVSNLRRLRPMKESSSAEMEANPVLKKPRILPPGGFSSASSGDKKFDSHSEPVSAHFSERECSDKPVLKKPRILPPGGFSSASSGDKKFASHSEPVSAHFSETECSDKPVLKKPRILPPGGFSSASSGDKKFDSHSEPVSAHFSETECSDTRTVQNSIESANADEEKSSTKSCPAQELKNKGEVTSSSLLTSRKPLSCSDATGQAELPLLLRPSHQNLKSPQGSDSRLNDARTSDGTGSVLSHKSETADHATNYHAEDSSSVLAADKGREKYLNKCCAGNLAPPLCYHLNVNGSLAVPVFDYIWKGEFQVHNSRKLPGVLCRIQAHLSTQSSPKISEVVKKFSDKILLEEVPRLTTWPIQFLEYQPQDDSIGLYFFAQDIESYSKYKSFLQFMIDYDLSLRGNFNGIELLIFPSNLLPEKSRRWNKLLFLWGIFKQRNPITT